SEDELFMRMDNRGIYLFPIEIVLAFYDAGKHIYNGRCDSFVLMRESAAKALADCDRKTYDSIGLKSKEYNTRRFENLKLSVTQKKSIISSAQKSGLKTMHD